MSKTRKEVKKAKEPSKAKEVKKSAVVIEADTSETVEAATTVTTPLVSNPPQSKAIPNLKSVDPFAFVGKATSQHSDHRTQVIVSGLASLQLEESQRLAELFLATNFEQHFFKHFHPTGSLSAFASESVEERRASSKLMAPVLCSSLLKMAGDLKRDLPASVLEALLCSGHLTVYRSDLVDRVLQGLQSGGSRKGTLLRALLHSMNDFSDAELVKLLEFVLTEGGKYFTYAAEVDVFLMKLMVMPKSPLLLKTYLMAWSDKLVLALLGRIEGLLKKQSCTSAARQAVLFDWLAVCIDSQYPLCVIKPEFIERLSSIQALLKEQECVDYEMAGLAGVLKTVLRGKKDDFMRFLPKRDEVITASAHYSIELTDL